MHDDSNWLDDDPVEDRTRAVFEQPYRQGKIFIRNVDPHGFFEIFMEFGPKPKEFNCSFTRLDMAKTKVQQYIDATPPPSPPPKPVKSERAVKAQITKNANKRAALENGETKAG